MEKDKYILIEENKESGLFYLYEMINPNKGLPFYVGKGKLNRYTNHFNFNSSKNHYKINTIKNILSKNEKVIIKIIFRSDDELLVLKKENELVLKYGRLNNGTGILTNLTDGGEGLSGFIPSDELRKRWSESRKGQDNGMYNKKHTQTSKEKISNTKKEKYKSGEILPTVHTKEWKEYLKFNNPNSKEVDVDLIIELNSKGYSIPEIERMTGFSIGIIRRRLKNNNIEVVYKKTKNIDMNIILDRLSNGIDKIKVCEEFGISISTLNRRIRSFDKSFVILQYGKEKDIL